MWTGSTGNVFADLELANAEEMFAKADLAYQINSLIKRKKLTQAAAAKLLGLDQPKISLLRKGKLSGFSMERLFRLLTILGQDITIKITKARSRKKSNVSVQLPEQRRLNRTKSPSNSSNAPVVHARRKKA